MWEKLPWGFVVSFPWSTLSLRMHSLNILVSQSHLGVHLLELWPCLFHVGIRPTSCPCSNGSCAPLPSLFAYATPVTPCACLQILLHT